MTKVEFVTALKRMTNGMDEGEIAEIADVSTPTVRRWLSSQNVPHKNMRPGVISNLKRKLVLGAKP